MIYKEGTRLPVTEIHGKDSEGVIRTISAVYNGYGRLIWQAVRSCFGRGYWINNKPWLNTDAWKNNP